MTLVVQTLTAERFAPYGQVIRAPDRGRMTFTESLSHDQRSAVLSTTRAGPVKLPMTLSELERHRYSSQTFLPLDVSRWLIIVSNRPEVAGLRVFSAGPAEGVTIGRGVWHHGLTVLDRAASFAVLMWKDGLTDDEFIDIDPISISL